MSVLSSAPLRRRRRSIKRWQLLLCPNDCSLIPDKEKAGATGLPEGNEAFAMIIHRDASTFN
jgi:hypothetical protein